MEGLIVLVVLALLAVPVLLIAALVMISGLKQRVGRLEADVQALRGASQAAEPSLGDWMRAQPSPAQRESTSVRREPMPGAAVASSSLDTGSNNAASGESAASPAIQPPTDRTVEPEDGAAVSAAVPPPLPDMPARAAASTPSVRDATPPASARPRIPTPPRRPDPLTLGLRAVRRWFTEGNVPVKVGVLVLFAGVAALLKYATDQGWLHLPIELRLAGVALSALGGLVFAWRQRETRRSFALAVQGGAIGVLLLVAFAAFKLYHLIPAGAAFGLSVAIVAGAGVLAVLQDALALAVLALLAGFLAPLWLSTGSGNHVALFGYYAVLNAAIFVIAWFRSWRLLNLLGFVFTFGIGTLWGAWDYKPEKFGTTQPFLALFYAFYLLIPIFHVRRRAGRRGAIEGCLVFGTPLVAFSLEAGLLHGTFPDAARMMLAFCALGLGVVYAALAWLLRNRERLMELSTPCALLAVGFATLAVPLALSAQATASVFALEGAALAWLGLHQGRRLPQATGLLLQLLAALSFVIGVGNSVAPLQAVVNARFMGALLIALAGFACAWSYRRKAITTFALPYYLWGLAWWAGNGLTEIARFVADPVQVDATMLFVVATGWIAAEVQRRAPARALAWTAVAAMALPVVLALVQATTHAHPFRDYGLVAWLLYAVAGWRILGCLRVDVDVRADADVDHADVERDGPAHANLGIAVAHSAWLWAWPLAVALFLQHFAHQAQLGDGWRLAAFGLPWLLTAALVQWRPALVAMPLVDRFAEWRAPLQGSFIAALALAALGALFAPGAADPLPWVAMLNPLDLAQAAVLVLAMKWLASELAPDDLRALRIPALAAAAFALITTITLRATHHWGGIAWDSAMFSASLVQTSLTIVWSVLGVLGWIVGSRRGQRGLWLAGAVLMAVVLAKLVLVDRQHLGNLLGIASFIAYGLLCTAVGYFAPAPPRAASDESNATEETA
ncbi:DUF2339 domain-containing protein [Lysobacter fragariae]